MSPSPSASLPIVAIVGRPNVGKSTLFNRMVGERSAIVEDTAGTTRDRVYGEADWNGRRFRMVDTGGLELEPGTNIEARVQDQARVAIDEADLVLFVVDAAAGLAPLDHEVADRLRRAHRPTILVINKADNPRREVEGAEFYGLGFEPAITISAQHGRSTGDLADLIVEHLPPPAEEEGANGGSGGAGAARDWMDADWSGVDLAEGELPEGAFPDGALSDADAVELAETEMGPPKVAIVGRPNTGKSTLVNRVIGHERMIVSDVPGTTRDAIDSEVTIDGEPMILIDTAGIRRRGSIQRGTEQYSVLRSLKAIDRADVAVVLTDAEEGFTAQDAHVVGYVLEAGKGLVLVINKWDVVEKDDKTADEWLHSLRRDAPYLEWADIVFASALTGQRVDRILRRARAVAEERYRRVATADVNRVIADAVLAHPPPNARGRRPRILYATQVAVAPPTFVIFVNDPAMFHFSYRRFLENRLRDAFGFAGTPIRIILRPRAPGERAPGPRPRRRPATRTRGRASRR